MSWPSTRAPPAPARSSSTTVARSCLDGQMEHQQIFPRAGWVEHDPLEIWTNVREVVGVGAVAGDIHAATTSSRSASPTSARRLWSGTGRRASPCTTRSSGRTPGPRRSSRSLAAPRAPTASRPGRPAAGDLLHGAEGEVDPRQRRGRPRTGRERRAAAGHDGQLGAVEHDRRRRRRRHLTDVTNASRTMLMNIETLDWNADICAEMGIPMSMLPEIRSSSEVYGEGRTRDSWPGIPIAGILGDQQAATFGQACFEPGHGEEHLRHRQLPAAQHRDDAGAQRARAAHHGVLRIGERPRSMRWRVRSR